MAWPALTVSVGISSGPSERLHACMCFFGFLQSGEVVVPSNSMYDPAVHLSHGDVWLDNAANS